MSLTPRHWMALGGTPVGGVAPTRLTVHPIGASLNSDQKGMVSQTYGKFCDQVRTSSFPDGYHKREMTYPDGTVVVMDSMQGRHRVWVEVQQSTATTRDRPTTERFIFLLRLGQQPSAGAPNIWGFYNNISDSIGQSLQLAPTVYFDQTAEFVLFSADSNLSDIKLEMGTHKVVDPYRAKDPFGGSITNQMSAWDAPDGTVSFGSSAFVMPGLTKLGERFYGTRVVSSTWRTFRMSGSGEYRWYPGPDYTGGGPYLPGEYLPGELRVVIRDASNDAAVVSIGEGESPSGGALLSPPAGGYVSTSASLGLDISNGLSGASMTLWESNTASANYTLSLTARLPVSLNIDTRFVGYFNSVDLVQRSLSAASWQVDFVGGSWNNPYGDVLGVAYKFSDVYQVPGTLPGQLSVFKTFSHSGESVASGSSGVSRSPPKLDPFGFNRAPDTISPAVAEVYQRGGCILTYRLGNPPYYISPGAQWAAFVPFGLTAPFTYTLKSRVNVPPFPHFSSGDVLSGPGSQPLRCVTPTQALWLWNPPFANGHYFSRTGAPERTSPFIANAASKFMLMDHGKKTPRVVRSVSDMLADLANAMGVDNALLSGALVTFHQPDFNSIQPKAEYVGI